VPEINLTPQMRTEFARRFPGARVVTLTSAIAANERAEAWLAAQSGAAQVVLGTRLAVFAPLPALGLVVVDEEQDTSFKQQEGVRYSARDLAMYRAHAAGVPVVLGSATPSLESWMHARSGRYRLLELKERARPGSRLPEVRLVDAQTSRAAACRRGGSSTRRPIRPSTAFRRPSPRRSPRASRAGSSRSCS
jgi:primosomal protein N' (replication factor Y)